ncbi:unnamed protein product, partial [Hapterophycus canaliculatus]
KNSDTAPPCSLLASGVPRIVILDENAVYDHYMRRLNRVWMRRMKASRNQAGGHTNLQSRDPSFRRVIRAPSFGKDRDEKNENNRRHGRRPSSGTELRSRQSRSTEKVRTTGLRPKSAPVFMGAPSKAWADLRDRTHAARGPGPTSCRHRCHHGGYREGRNSASAARPDSAPTRHNRYELDAILSSRERSPSTQRYASAWLPPRVTRLERETHDLLTACRKAGRDTGYAARLNDEDCRHGCTPEGQSPGRSGECRRISGQSNSYGGSFRSDEKIEDLGRGAVIRLIGNLGMGRYAHRFRAFAVTGSDLASCTEEDLVQIGVSFRPHRIRLLKEIAIRKDQRHGSGIRGREKSTYNATETWATSEINTTSTAPDQHDSFNTLVAPGQIDPSAPDQRGNPKAITATSTKDERSASKKPSDAGRTNEATDSTSTSTACTTYERAVPPTVEPTSFAQDCVPTARVEGDKSHGSSGGKYDRGGKETLLMSAKVAGSRRIVGEDNSSRACGTGQNSSEGTGLTRRQVQMPGSGEFHGQRTVVPFAQAHDKSAKQGLTTSELKGTLQMCGVRTADMKLALVGRDPFLQVKACDQLRRINVAAGAGAEASWDDAVVSFSVTDQTLPSDGVQIELCCGNIGAQDLFASGCIPGDVTLQLLCRLQSDGLESVRPSADESAGGNSAVSHASGSLAVLVRLFAEAGGEEAGVCTLNLKFKPDNGAVLASEAEDRRSSEQTEARREPETAAVEEMEVEALATAPEGVEHRRSSSTLLKGTAKHIEAIEEVCQHAYRQQEHSDQSDRGEAQQDLASRTEIQSSAASITSNREAKAVGGVPPSLEKVENVLAPHDAAVILQSHTRRRAAKRVAKRRVKERTAANRVQAFARQRMDVSKVRQARERELATMHQERCDAVVRLQGTARRRIAAKAVQRRRSEEAELAKRDAEAAQTLQGFARHQLRKRARRRQVAATKMQGISSIRAAKAEVRRRKAEKQLEAKRKSDEEAAALQIQTAVRRQRAAHEQHLVQSRQRNQAAVKLQSMARSRSAQSKACRQRGRQALLKTAARITVQDALKQALENCVARVMEMRRRAASDCLRQALGNQRDVATGATYSTAPVKKDAKTTVASACILHAFDKKQRPTNEAADESYTSLPEAGLSLKGSTKIESDAAVTLATADDAPTEKENSELARLMDEAESFRQLEMAAAAEEQRTAARRIQGLCRKRRARRKTDRRDTLSHSPPVVSAGCTTRFTQELMDSRKSEEAATHIQRAFRTWCLVRQARGLSARKTTAVICIQQATRSRTAFHRVADLRAKQRDLVQIKLRTEADQAVIRGEAAECIQRGVRTRRALILIDRLRRKKKMQETGQRKAAECIQRSVRCKQAGDRVAYLRQQREHRCAQGLKRQQTAEREAAISIQRSVRSKQASDRVSALRQEREIKLQWALEQAIHVQVEIRRDAAMYIQRAIRCRQACSRMAEARRRRHAELHREVRETEKRKAVECIQRAVRSKQASYRVSAMRQERIVETQRAQEQATAKQAEMRRDASMCIQRAVWCRQAFLRVADARRRRDAQLQRDLEEMEQTKAAECIQRAVRSKQASDRVSALRHEREIEIQWAEERARIEQVEMRRDAAMCIQRAVWCRQACLRVAKARWRRDAELQRKLRETENKAAECIQRAVRSRQALDRVSALRQERRVETQRAQEQAATKQRGIRRDAAMCIQRAIRCKQAFLRMTDARRRRYTELQRDLEAAEQRKAAECIQRAVRSKQALGRVSALRQEREIEVQRTQERARINQANIRRDAAAMCVQRAVRCRQASLRVATARQERDIQLDRALYDVEMVQESRTRGDASECIQRAVRMYQAGRKVSSLRRQRDASIARKQEMELRHQTAEQESESVSLKFAKMMEAARQESASAIDSGFGTIPALLPPQEQDIATGLSLASELAGDLTHTGVSDSPDFDQMGGNVSSHDGRNVQRPTENETWEVVVAPDAENDFFEGSTQALVVSGEGRETTGRGSASEDSRWSGSSYDTESPIATGSDLDTFQNSDDLHVAEKLSGEISSVHSHDLALGRVDELNDGQGQEIDTSIELLPPEGEEAGSLSSTVGAVAVQSEESSRLETQLAEILEETSNADQSQGTDDAGSVVLHLGATETGMDEMGAETSPEHPRNAAGVDGRQEFARSDSSAFYHEHPAVGGETASNWEPHVDKESGNTYYFHPETKACSWELPSHLHKSSGAQGLPHREARLPMLQESDGDEQFSLTRSGPVDAKEAVVETSAEGQLSDEGADRHGHREVDPSGFRNEIAHTTEGDKTTGEEAEPLHEEGQETNDYHGGQGDGWQEIVDPESGSRYFYNPMTRQSTWDMPEGAIAAAINAASAGADGVTT